MIRELKLTMAFRYDDESVAPQNAMDVMEIAEENLQTAGSELGVLDIKSTVKEKTEEPEAIHFPKLMGDKYTPKQAYDGNMTVPECAWFTDGAMAIIKAKVTTSKKTKALEKENTMGREGVGDEQVNVVWNGAVTPASWELYFEERTEAIGDIPTRAKFKIDKRDKKAKKDLRKTVVLNVHKLLFIIDCVKPDQIRSTGEMKPVIFYRDDLPVAILMPLRNPE
jgi:hypothetical protein